MKRVCVIIIGAEILDGSVADRNIQVLARAIRGAGSALERVLVIPDDEATIQRDLRETLATFDLVISCGGLGPTPDDVTFKAAAAALDLPLAPQPELTAFVNRRYSGVELEGALRMTLAPAGTAAIPGGLIPWPVLLIRNLVLLPGVPELLEDKVPALLPLLASEGRFHRLELRTTAREALITPLLEETCRRFPQVAIGSYPRREPSPHVLLSFTSRDGEAARSALEHFSGALETLRPGSFFA
jgi:molybdenum cofactor synthesis domain-containing protein